jgi:hypothetical protein
MDYSLATTESNPRAQSSYRLRNAIAMTARPLMKPLWFGLSGTLLLGSAVWFCGSHVRATNTSSGVDPETACPVPTLATLLDLPATRLPRVGIARMNLLCAQGLPRAEGLDPSCLLKLDEMAARVRSETERHFYRFQRNPADFEHSDGFFRMLMLAVVLAEDFGVQYAPARVGTAADAQAGDGFFADARDVFLQGLTGPRRQGTCSSLPVLQVAVGRRLGYPLKLVTTKGHLFVRWEGAGERFNIEAAGKGVNRFTDDYYRHWPLEITPAEEAAEGYLKSLTPSEELAVFLSIRGMCLREAGRLSEAADAFAAAARLAPACRSYQVMLASLQASGAATPRLAKSPAEKTTTDNRNLNL